MAHLKVEKCLNGFDPAWPPTQKRAHGELCDYKFSPPACLFLHHPGLRARPGTD